VKFACGAIEVSFEVGLPHRPPHKLSKNESEMTDVCAASEFRSIPIFGQFMRGFSGIWVDFFRTVLPRQKKVTNRRMKQGIRCVCSSLSEQCSHAGAQYLSEHISPPPT